MKIKDVLKNGIQQLNKCGVEDAILKSKMLLQYELKAQSQYLIIHAEDDIYDDVVNKFNHAIIDIINGKPLQYITNQQSFYGLDFFVNESVLIPQPDTEILVEEVINISKKINKALKILDICTGSGAIAIALSKNVNQKIIASDISESALEIAKKNAISNHANVEFIQSDMFNNIIGTFDIIVSNPPYIESKVIESLPKEVKKEPILALDGGEDGLDFYRIIAKNAKNYMTRDGYIALEIGYNQKESVIEILKSEGYKDIYSQKDYSQNDRIIVGRWR